MASKRKKTDPQPALLPAAISFPWHQAVWQQLVKTEKTALDQLSHALLLHGHRGLGKTGFVMRLAHSLLCESPGTDNQACGQCKSCLLLKAGNHPDLACIRPTEEGKAITVDQIRELVDFLYLKPHIARRKVIVIQPAENMNIHAANSLLKMLEEPPLGNVLLLVSNQAGKLPVTIRSRCQSLAFTAPDSRTASGWLHAQGADVVQAEQALGYASGSPLLALELLQSGFLEQSLDWLRDLATLFSTNKGDASEIAAKWKKAGSSSVLLWLQSLVQELIRRANRLDPVLVVSDDRADQWLQDAIKQLNLSELFSFLDEISETRLLLDAPLDEQLLLESLLIRWRAMSMQAMAKHNS